MAWSFRLYTGSLALQPSVVTALVAVDRGRLPQSVRLRDRLPERVLGPFLARHAQAVQSREVLQQLPSVHRRGSCSCSYLDGVQTVAAGGPRGTARPARDGLKTGQERARAGGRAGARTVEVDRGQPLRAL